MNPLCLTSSPVTGGSVTGDEVGVPPRRVGHDPPRVPEIARVLTYPIDGFSNLFALSGRTVHIDAYPGTKLVQGLEWLTAQRAAPPMGPTAVAIFIARAVAAAVPN